MAKKKFEIGEKEKHLIEVDTNLLWKTIKIKLDGRTVADEFYPLPSAKKFHFDVGDNEQHKVEISVGMLSPIKLLVDSKPAKNIDSNR